MQAQNDLGMIGMLADNTIQGAIHGTLGSLKNRRQLVYSGGKPRFIKEPAAISFEKRFNLLCDMARRDGLLPSQPIEAPASLVVVVYAENLRRDLDIELLCDCLQSGGVIKNDRQIWHKEATRRLDRENPRITFTLSPWIAGE